MCGVCTETGAAITATCVALDDDLHPPAGVAGKPVPGWDGMSVSRCFLYTHFRHNYIL